MAAKANTAPANPFGRTDEDAYDKDREYSSFFKPAKGENRIRVLPHSAQAEEQHNRRVPYIQIYTHFGIGGDRSLVCPLKSGVATKCYICGQVAKIPDKEDRREVQAKKRYRFCVWDYDHPDRGIQLWEIGWTVKEQLDNVKDKHGDFTDPENGFDIFIDKSGDGVHSKYQIQPARNDSPLGEEIIKWAVEKGIPDLEGGVVVPTAEELRAAWEGGADEDEDEDGKDSAPPAWATKQRDEEPSEEAGGETPDELPFEQQEDAEEPTAAVRGVNTFGRTRSAPAADSPLSRFKPRS